MKTAFTYHRYSHDDQKKEIQGLKDEIKELREYIQTPLLKRIFRTVEYWSKQGLNRLKCFKLKFYLNQIH